MSNHANDVTIGEYVGGEVTVKMYGELSTHIEGLRRYVTKAEGVRSANIFDDETVVANCSMSYPGDTPEQVRIRIRNRCRDYFHEVTGYLTNLGPNGSYVDLIEKTELAA